MAEPYSRLESTDQRERHLSEGAPQDPGEPSLDVVKNLEEIPIFCAGGCGEVMGYVRKDDGIPRSWCPICESKKASASEVIEAMRASGDELAGLHSTERNLRTAHLVQVLAVSLIFAGSIYIALGRTMGIYLAAIGTLAWVAVGLVLWRLRN
jgi:hypothetical protein